MELTLSGQWARIDHALMMQITNKTDYYLENWLISKPQPIFN